MGQKPDTMQKKADSSAVKRREVTVSTLDGERKGRRGETGRRQVMIVKGALSV